MQIVGFNHSPFENAIAELNCVTEDLYKVLPFFILLLRNNLTLWASDKVKGQY